MIALILLILLAVVIMAPISILVGRIMKSNVPAKKNAIIGSIAFFIAGIAAFFGNMLYYKYFVPKSELYYYQDTLMGRVVTITVLLAIIGWLITIYAVNKKNSSNKENI